MDLFGKFVGLLLFSQRWDFLGDTHCVFSNFEMLRADSIQGNVLVHFGCCFSSDSILHTAEGWALKRSLANALLVWIWIHLKLNRPNKLKLWNKVFCFNQNLWVSCTVGVFFFELSHQMSLVIGRQDSPTVCFLSFGISIST